MKIERTKNSIRNIKYGILLKIYQIITPFIIRTIMIYYLGIEYVGLNSLFTSILSVLNLAELGVGTAMVFSMYKPIAEDDTSTICALLNLYKKYYRIIGAVVLVGGLIVLPFVPYLISGDVPDDINIYILFSLNLASTVLSYWLFAYKTSLFSAHQRGDITNKFTIIFSAITYLLQILGLLLFRSYYLYLIVAIGTQIIQNIVTALYAKKIYPKYLAKGVLPVDTRKDINKRIRDLFTSKVGAIVLNSSDAIVISAFLGISVLGIYNNYYYIMSSIIGFLEIIYYSCMAGIGNSIITETKEKNLNDFKTLTLIISFISTIATCCFLNLYQPFMNLWMHNDKSKILDFSLVICLCVYFYVFEINRVANLYKDAAGIWHVDRFRPLVTAGTNLALNLLLVNYIGLFGVLLSTVFATVFVNCPWLYTKLFGTVFNRSSLKEYVKSIFKYTLIAITCCILTYIPCSFVNFGNIITIIIRLLICIVIATFFMIIVLRRDSNFIEAKKLISRIILKK